MTASDDFLAALTRHSAMLERHKKKAVRDIIALVDKVHGDLAAEVARREIQSMSKRELNALLSKLSKVAKDGYAPVLAKLADEVDELAEFEAEWTQKAVKSALPVDIRQDLGNKLASPAAIHAAIYARPFQGYLLKEWFAGMAAGVQKRIRQVVRQGYADGMTSARVIQLIRGFTDRDGVKHKGIANIGRQRAAAAVQTAMAHTASVARSKYYEANSDLIDEEIYVATLDTRTSMQCRVLDGKRFPVGKGPHPPIHINCRSSRAPVLKSWRKLGYNGLPSKTRASMNGQVPSDVNYEDWLRQQPAAIQDQVMGHTKGRAFRRGKPLSEFADKFGNELSIEQLKQMDADAFG